MSVRTADAAVWVLYQSLRWKIEIKRENRRARFPAAARATARVDGNVTDFGRRRNRVTGSLTAINARGIRFLNTPRKPRGRFARHRVTMPGRSRRRRRWRRYGGRT